MSKNDSCPSCKKKFGLFRQKAVCPECGKDFCTDCLQQLPDVSSLTFDPFSGINGTRLCKVCWSSMALPVKSSYDQALSQKFGVEIFEADNPDKPELSGNSPGKELISDFFKTQEEAEDSLKITAAFLECNVIYDLHWEKQARKSGNGYQTVWRGKALAGILA